MKKACTMSRFIYYLFDDAGKPFILLVNGLPSLQREIVELKVT
jgi:hypothetical protein